MVIFSWTVSQNSETQLLSNKSDSCCVCCSRTVQCGEIWPCLCLLAACNCLLTCVPLRGRPLRSLKLFLKWRRLIMFEWLYLRLASFLRIRNSDWFDLLSEFSWNRYRLRMQGTSVIMGTRYACNVSKTGDQVCLGWYPYSTKNFFSTQAWFW